MAGWDHTFDMGKLLNEVTVVVTVKERPQTKLRFWIGKKLLTLAIQVIGCRIEYHAMEEPIKPDRFEVMLK